MSFKTHRIKTFKEKNHITVKALNHDTLSTVLKLLAINTKNLYDKDFKTGFDFHDS